MRIPVVVRRVPGSGYLAEVAGPLDLIAVGTTRDAALQQLRILIEAQITAGTEITSIEIGEKGIAHPWLPFAGMFRDDPLIDEWKQTMAAARHQEDEAS